MLEVPSKTRSTRLARRSAQQLDRFTISIRSTPDVLLSLFVLLSLWGFARILFEGNRSWSSYALAWVGAGLAVQTKGLLGIDNWSSR